jgi:hypothetical protein
MLKAREKKYLMSGQPMSRTAFLRAKRAQSRLLLAAIERFRNGCAHLPPAQDNDGGDLLDQVVAWVQGPCRDAWRRV